MKLNRHFIILLGKSLRIRNLRFLLLLVFFISVHSFALAQQVRPKWVDDLTNTQSTGNSQVSRMTTDKQNNIYVVGYFNGTVDFDPSAGVKNLTSVGAYDVFVAKYKQDGTLIWAESMGGNGDNEGEGIVVDKDGNISVTGYYGSPVFDADPGTGVYDFYDTTDHVNGFLIHLDSNGHFLWANSVNGGEGPDDNRVATDSLDNVIITSAFIDTLTISGKTYTPFNFEYGLIEKFDSAGNLLWDIVLQPTQYIGANVIDDKVDSQGNIIVTGNFANTVNFNPLGTAYTLTAPLFPFSFFVAKYSPAGILIWANAINSIGGYPLSPALALDRQDNIYFSSAFQQYINFNGSNQLTAKGAVDICLAKFSSGGILQVAKSIGGPTGTAFNTELAIDKNNNVFATGYFGNTVNFNPNTGTAANLTFHGISDLYVAEYDQNFNYINAFNIGNPNCGSTLGYGLAVDTNNNLDLAGAFCSSVNFSPVSCPDSLTATGPTDPFIVQYGPAAIVNNIINPPTVSGFCTNGTPGAITGNLPAGGSGTYTYQWLSSTDSVTFADINGATAQNYTPSTITATTYYERMVSSDTCAAPTVSNIVGLHVLPALAATTVNVAAITSSTVIITWAAISGATGYMVSIDNGQTYTPVTGLKDTISGLKPGQSLTITVEATGSIPCQLSVSTAVTAKVPSGDIVYCPNAFTPNGDGRNDVWNVAGENIASLKYSIYDQWGELLFTSTSLQNSWDGTYKGTKEPAGVYVYYLEAVMNDGQDIKKKGTINLLK